MKHIVFEVGVNLATDTQHILNSFPDSDYYGFEPTVDIYGQLVKKFAKENPKLTVMPFAISDYDGFASFNVMGMYDWGCSSLNNFADKVDEKHLLDFPEFKTTEQYKVPVIRIDTFIKNFIKEDVVIDYAWIDAQGEDLKVLESFGDYLPNLIGGRVEVACKTNSLYKDTEHNSFEKAVEFFEKHGFQYKNLGYQAHGNEANLEFYR